MPFDVYFELQPTPAGTAMWDMKPLKFVHFVFRLLSFVVGTLSIVAIMQYGLAVSFVAALHLLLDYYDWLIRLLLGWATPYIREMLAWIGKLVGWDLQLYSQWHHILVLLWLYFGTHARMAWNQGNKTAAIFNATWGGLVALVVVVLIGLTPATGSAAHMLLPIAAVLSVFIYGLGTSARAATFFRNEGELWWHAFREFVRHSLRFAIVGGITIAVTVLLGSQQTTISIQALGLLILLVLVCSLAVYRIAVGPRWGRYEPDKSGTWWQRTRRSGEAKIGFYILGVIGSALLFVLLNAGLKLWEH